MAFYSSQVTTCIRVLGVLFLPSHDGIQVLGILSTQQWLAEPVMIIGELC